jgi:YD repeat-containing protein
LSVTDKINGIQKSTNAYTYDILNRVTKLTQSGTGVTSKRVDMTYNAVNQIATLNRYSDLTGTSSVANTSYTYDLAGRLQTLTHQHGATTLASYELTYDNANRIIQSSGTDGVQDYSYDSTNQLTVATHTTQTDEAYSYDANGNRTSGGSSAGTNNQLLTDGTYNYEYDGEGNRTKRTEIVSGKVTEYVWDYRNRLTSVLFKDASGTVTKTIQYIYDVNDRRIGKKIDGVVTERYVYDGSNIALVFDGAGTQTHRYLYGVGVDQVLADERGGTVVWALSDNQGTVRDLADKDIPGNNMGLTVGGRTLDKHANQQGGRGTTPFPKLKGGPKERSRVAAEQVDDIITSPDAVFVRLGRGGLEVRIPDGRGARWDSDGSFNTFVH